MNTSNETSGPEAIDVAAQMGEMGAEQSIKLLKSTPIGRIGFETDGDILVLPVNFRWHEDSIVFRSLEGQKLAAASNNQSVCFEVDHWDAQSRTGWSVVVQGTANEVTDWAEKAQLEEIGLVPWAKEKWRPMWIRIDPSTISGRVLQ